jgi:regulator of protease activity HflC (stomatin/prohibitin superfamily)
MVLQTIFLFIIGSFVLLGLRKIPIHHVGQVTRLGRRVPGEYREEGWNWIPFWEDIISINIERITFTVTAEKALTPDRASSKIPVTITWRPVKGLLCEYINSKNEEGVKEQLTGKIQERIREWCVNTEEGPATWYELNQTKLEGTSVLVKRIASNSLAEVPDYAQSIPTWIWLVYFSNRKPKTFTKNEEAWSKNDWKLVKDVLSTIETTLGINAVTDLKVEIEKRREEVNSIRTGTGAIIVEDLGIVIERLNIGEVEVLGEVAKAAEQQAKELQEREAEKLELDGVEARMKTLMAPPFNFSNSEARELIQTERKKVIKTINETKINVSESTSELVKILGTEIIDAIIKKTKKS